jgi:hypothetical protein
VAARDDDFLGDGTVDPFTGLAPALSPEEEQRLIDARHAQARAAATRTANTNIRQNPDGRTPIHAGRIDPKTGQRYTGMERPETAGLFDKQFWKESWDTVKEHPWLPLLPLAPLALAAAAPAAAGSGSISAANAGLAASESAAASAPTTVGYAATSAPFSMASPSVAAAGAAPATPAATAAATPTFGSMIGADLGKYAGTAAIAAAPYAINALLGGRTKEEKALIAKQEQLAQEAKVRQGQQQDARMNQLGQQLLAFNPSNQLMAKMYGPDAAFSPEQMAGMVQGQPPPAPDASLVNYQGTDPKKRAEVAEWIRRKKEYDAAEAARRESMLSGSTPLGPGPAPIQMSAPQAARRY